MGQLLNGSGSGARLKYNLFVQPTKPDVKDGLWIKTLSDSGFNDIVVKNAFGQSGQFQTSDINGFKTFPIAFDQSSILSDYTDGVHQYFLLFGTSNNSTQTTSVYTTNIRLYEYNVLNGDNNLIFSKSIVNTGYYCFANLIGPYLFICQNSTQNNSTVFAYNITTNEQMITYNLANEIATNTVSNSVYDNISKNIYFIYSYSPFVKKFDITTLQLTTIQFNVTESIDFSKITSDSRRCVIRDNIIYAFFKNYVLELNLNNITYNIVKATPWSSYSGNYIQINTITVMGYIYLLIDYDSNQSIKYIYRYNQDLGTFTLLGTRTDTSNIELNIIGIVNVPNYGLYYEAHSRENYYAPSGAIRFSFESETIPTKSLCIQSGKTYNFKLINYKRALNSLPKYSTSNILLNDNYKPISDFSIADAWIYTNKLEESYPTYIGDGTQWNKIKN